MSDDDQGQPRTPEELRGHPRFEVTAYVDYTGTEVLLYHHIENLSLGGMCIQTSMLEEIGTTVEMVINFPELDTSLALQGEVVWTNRDQPMDMGVRFLDLDEERKTILRQHIEAIKKKRHA
ncbi:MAG: TIGR02266 family protein [Deltaproteobacteria bacterium]|nr:TIGR02266 family protein [Deltaproteobacteria bacterium]